MKWEWICAKVMEVTFVAKVMEVTFVAKVIEVTFVAKVMEVTFVAKFATPSNFRFTVSIKGEFTFALHPFFSLFCLCLYLGDE